MKFESFVCFEATIPELTATNRNDAIAELVEALARADALPAKSVKTVAAAVIKREDEASTGIGKGVAVPHVKSKAVARAVAAVGQSTAGLDFAALDEQPVYSVILLVSPVDQPEMHLEVMENIFKHLQKEKFRRFLRQCRTPDRLRDLLREADEAPSW
jgi:mannitol/fructose-specific phosphotransferase system IIA component (Ntr-type)